MFEADGDAGTSPPTTPAPGSRLSLRALGRRASGLAVVNVVAAGVSIPTTFLVARWIGPRDFGRTQYVLLAYLLATLLRSGVFEGGIRAYIHDTGTGEVEAGERARNVGLTYELIASALPGLALIGFALLLSDPLRRFGLLLGPLAVLASSFNGFLGGVHAARQRFDLVARISLVRTVVFPAALLLGVPTVGARAVFIAPILADVCSVGLYLLCSRKLGIEPAFDRQLGGKLLRAGLPLGAGAVVYWAYRLVGSTTVALGSSARSLGYYAFAAAPVAIVLRLVGSLQAVTMPAVWVDMAETGPQWGAGAGRLTIGIAVLAATATNLLQAAFGPLVHLVTRSYIPAGPLLNILSFDVLLLSVGTVPSLVLDSAVVNRQAQHLAIWTGGLVLNIAANVGVVVAGLSITAVAWNDLWVQAVVLGLIFRAAHRFVADDMGSRDLYLRLATIGGLAVVVAVVLSSVGTEARSIGGVVLELALRLAPVLAVWAAAGTLLLGVKWRWPWRER